MQEITNLFSEQIGCGGRYVCSAIYVLCICSSASITNVSSVKLSHKTALSLLSLFTSSALQERHFNIFTSLGKKHLKVGCYVRKKTQ